MILFPETVKNILAHGGAVRLSTKGLMHTTMQEYAAYARSGGAHVTFVVGDALLMPNVMYDIAADGKGHVTFNFVSRDGWD